MNEKVLKIIDSEVEYATGKWEPDPTRPKKDADKPVEFWLTFIRIYLRKAEDACYGTDKTEAMDNVRKIAGLCARCIEHSPFARERCETDTVTLAMASNHEAAESII